MIGHHEGETPKYCLDINALQFRCLLSILEAKDFRIQIFGDSSNGQRKKIEEEKKQQRRKEEKAYLEEMVAG